MKLVDECGGVQVYFYFKFWFILNDYNMKILKIHMSI
jgi:hypothetical protein